MNTAQNGSFSSNTSCGKFIDSVKSDAFETGVALSILETMALEVMDEFHGDERHPYDTWMDLFNRVQDGGQVT